MRGIERFCHLRKDFNVSFLFTSVCFSTATFYENAICARQRMLYFGIIFSLMKITGNKHVSIEVFQWEKQTVLTVLSPLIIKVYYFIQIE